MVTISPAAARRFLVHAFALDGFQTLPDVAAAVDRLEFVQEDSINVCGRIHDLILWARVQAYRPALLHEHLYGERRGAFEYAFPNLCVLPLRDYPFFARAMRARAAATPGRWHGLTPDEETVAAWVLERIDAEGPLRTRATGAEHGRTTSGWGTQTTVAAHTIEKLWRQGVLSIAKRGNFERWFDRTTRLLPEQAALLAQGESLPTEEEEQAYRIRKRLRARRLFRLTPALRNALGEDAFVRVTVEGEARPWHALAEDAPALTQAEARADSDDVLLLAPLDPLVYDRERTRAVFGFDYSWEVYTPAAKRRWGYYVLPILQGSRLVGRMDPKIDRRAKTLILASLRTEPDADTERLAGPLAVRLAAYARFLGAERVRLPAEEGVSGDFRALLETHIAVE